MPHFAALFELQRLAIVSVYTLRSIAADDLERTMKSTLLIAIVAAAGVALSLLLRTTMTLTVGLTMTGPKMTHFVALNAIGSRRYSGATRRPRIWSTLNSSVSLCQHHPA